MTVDEALEFCKAGAIIDVNEQNLVVVSDAVTTLRDEVLRLREKFKNLSEEFDRIEKELRALREVKNEAE